ncbi:MAG: hypothetical protein LBF61_09010 [Azoarcus sp.]|nr:hypothetical protein [Azoarcus sp.]
MWVVFLEVGIALALVLPVLWVLRPRTKVEHGIRTRLSTALRDRLPSLPSFKGCPKLPRKRMKSCSSCTTRR